MSIGKKRLTSDDIHPNMPPITIGFKMMYLIPLKSNIFSYLLGSCTLSKDKK